MSHDIIIKVERDPAYPEDPTIEWEQADNDCERKDGLWQECIVDGCNGTRVDNLSLNELSAVEDDELLRHGHRHGIRDGFLADLELDLCLLHVDGVRDGIHEELHRLDQNQPLSGGDRFLVEADWEGDDDWAVSLLRISQVVEPVDGEP